MLFAGFESGICCACEVSCVLVLSLVGLYGEFGPSSARASVCLPCCAMAGKDVSPKSAAVVAKEYDKLGDLTLRELFDKICFDEKGLMALFEKVHGYAEFQVVSQAGVLEERVEKHGVRLGEIKCKPVAVCRGRGRIGKVVLFMTKQEFGGPGTAVVSVVRIPQDLLEKGTKTGVKDSKKVKTGMKKAKKAMKKAKKAMK